MSIKIITNNWHIKLLALLVAISMWVYAASSETSVAKFPSTIPIKQINLSPGLIAVYDQKEVKIEIAAEPGTWKQLSTESFTAYIDLTGLSVGTHDIPLNVTTLVSGLQIVSKDPSSVVVTIEPSLEKEIPVVVRLSGNAAENMVAGDVIFNPSTVKVSGPKSIIEGISQATAEIILSGEAETFSKSVKIVALDSQGKPIEYANFLPQTVSAEVRIVKAGNVKNVGIKVVTTGNPEVGYYISSVSTNPSLIAIVGTPEVVRALSSVSTQPIDIGNASSTINTSAKLSFPVGVQSVDNISSVNVIINFSQQAITKPLTIPVKTKNLPTNLKISPQTVDIVISGALDLIRGISSDNISLYLDLSSASAGSTISIQNGDFVLPAGVTLVSFQPTSVTIVLQ
ncbi:hypothetical protein AUJ40_02390 [Candidatus Berkelbacteria bacterium CG1_02_42_45]|uniref:Uncharacterized protein n=5 Tax=Candidatus Berkelbacteria TaxID=1618330 RepID=A0A2M7K269_9BACT|nr:MAG: hypothetical protein AUJ40_02390 [Candidatus Berkelbacteria bacterium CG1_02_42_45]PIP50692.1 MAG: hypothetical protein COX11_02795 [Candidatus Berkelbacteria bacterium CG23_combo_of_CG06-09_8_20_14_all_41_73]PIR27309.1 MAG: hypothetical protein COV40_01520 [Candidatus Berkelbacteria bacterium CG11_big_fil_rev_8_21_14_0_20_42_15]PIX30348.1 MAG: hypothetical protein COZ63_00260 [Candidatus Berkelbacteria bacterium CG_4_8_14_3_um_filter_42_13]